MESKLVLDPRQEGPRFLPSADRVCRARQRLEGSQPFRHRLRPTIKRITRLKATGLTIGHVGTDFLLRRIAPLQKRDMFAWEYGDAADRMRLLPSLSNNLSVYDHALLCDQLLGRFGLFKLLANVISININSSRDQILKWMRDCNAHGFADD